MKNNAGCLFAAVLVLSAFSCLNGTSVALGRSSKSLSVGSGVQSDYSIIQEAVDAAEPGEIINVKAGVYHENLMINKSIALFGQDSESTIIDGGGKGHVVLVDTDNVTLAGFTLRNSGTGRQGPLAGIKLNCSRNSLISNNTIVGNEFGVWFSDSSNNTFVNNVVANNSGTYGVRLYESGNNVLGYNHVANNSYGIYVYGLSNGNIVKRNNVSNNSFGLYVGLSNDNMIEGNSVVDSRMYGITLRRSGGNSIFHNNFLNSHFQTDTYEAFDNDWDDGYPSGGNCWSDYEGADEFSGVDQNVLGSDGLGDAEYGDKAGNLDRYPLMGIFSVFDVVWKGTSLSILAICNSSITGFSVAEDMGVGLKLNVSGAWETPGFCRLSLPKAFLQSGEFKVVFNGYLLLPTRQLGSSDGYDVLYFAYLHGPFVPEFSQLFLMLLILSLTIFFGLSEIRLRTRPGKSTSSP